MGTAVRSKLKEEVQQPFLDKVILAAFLAVVSKVTKSRKQQLYTGVAAKSKLKVEVQSGEAILTVLLVAAFDATGLTGEVQ